MIALAPPRYPKRNGYRAGECGREPLKDLERWVKGLTFHPYGVAAHDRAATVEEALENMRECPCRLEFTGEMLGYRGYVEFWITYRQAGDPDSSGFGGAYLTPEDAAYSALSMIEAHEREVYEENLVAGLA